MNVGSLFTGCYGLDLGLEHAGFRTVWACENDPACRRVLAERRPDVPIVADVRAVDESLPYVDVLAGGFPCQDLSYAGKGAGLDGERSGLWHEFARAVRVLRPRFVVVENVSALVARGLGRVLFDLAEAGYVGSWGCVRASDVGAPHRRERLFIVASLADPGRGGVERRRESGELASAQGAGEGEEPERERLWNTARDGRGAAADAERDGLGGPGVPERSSIARDGLVPPQHRPASSDAEGERLERDRQARRRRSRSEDSGSPTDWGAYEPAIRQWEAIHGPAPRPVDERRRLDPRFVEWMLGFPPGWVDVPGVSRTAQLRMLGNSVQVQVGEFVGAQLLAHIGSVAA